MLARHNSLKNKKDFDIVYKKGKRVNSTSFTLLFYKREDTDPSRFGFVISTKISKHATLRNRAKRALSEGVRQILVYIHPSFDCVFLAHPIIIKTYTQDLMNEVKSSFEKAKLLK